MIRRPNTQKYLLRQDCVLESSGGRGEVPFLLSVLIIVMWWMSSLLPCSKSADRINSRLAFNCMAWLLAKIKGIITIMYWSSPLRSRTSLEEVPLNFCLLNRFRLHTRFPLCFSFPVFELFSVRRFLSCSACHVQLSKSGWKQRSIAGVFDRRNFGFCDKGITYKRWVHDTGEWRRRTTINRCGTWHVPFSHVLIKIRVKKCEPSIQGVVT